MSTCYAPLKKVRACDLFDGRLEKFGVREQAMDDTTETNKCLTDGRNYLQVYIDDAGLVDNIRRAGPNAPSKILNAIADTFDTEIVSEYDGRYWGFATQEEWEAWNMEEAKKDDEKYYLELLKYLRGEPNDIRPVSVGMKWAEIVKKRVEKDPALLLPENKEKLIADFHTYLHEHSIRGTLSPQEMAACKMMATHEDDLPRA